MCRMRVSLGLGLGRDGVYSGATQTSSAESGGVKLNGKTNSEAWIFIRQEQKCLGCLGEMEDRGFPRNSVLASNPRRLTLTPEQRTIYWRCPLLVEVACN